MSTPNKRISAFAEMFNTYKSEEDLIRALKATAWPSLFGATSEPAFRFYAYTRLIASGEKQFYEQANKILVTQAKKNKKINAEREPTAYAIDKKLAEILDDKVYSHIITITSKLGLKIIDHLDTIYLSERTPLLTNKQQDYGTFKS